MEDHIVNEALHETLRAQLIGTQQEQHAESTHWHGYFQHPHQQLALNHSYDPNMCTTAARFSESFYNKTTKDVHTKSPATLQTTPPPTTASQSDHSEEELLDYNNTILMHNAHEIGAEAIVANCETLEEVSTAPELPMHALQRTEIHIPEEFFVPSSFQYMHFEHTALSHETMGAQAQVAGLLVHRSPNGHLYQQNYLVNAEHRAEKENDEYVQTQQIDVSSIFAVHAAAEAHSNGAHLQNFELPIQYDDAFQPSVNVVDDNSVEMIARYAADLAGVPAVPESYETPIERQLDLTSKDEQRLLLESTMSPLLAAVNDITKRNAELKLYLNPPIEKDRTHYLASLSIIEAKQNSVHNSSDEDDYLLVSDKAVECRAKASLPTNYLYFGDVENNTNGEPTVFAKKSIPRRTMFGPYEGQAVLVSEINLDVLHVQTRRCYPVLMIDENHILDVSNEETSNWMRYIRLAETYAQQNLQIMLEDSKIYLRCVRDVRPEEELRVGYHSSYAIRFILSTLQPPAADFKAGFCQTHPLKCSECEHCFTTSAQLKTHIKGHDAGKLAVEEKVEMDELSASEQKRPEMVGKRKHNRKFSKAEVLKARSTARTKDTIICRFCKKHFVTNEMLIHHLSKKHKSNEIIDSEYMFKCNLCAKRFQKEPLLKKHKATHADTLSKPYKCLLCHQQCSTLAALTAHLNGHKVTQYCCVFCEQKFKYVREFKNHVEKHKIGDYNGYFECIHCKKHYAHYHLVRKHVRIFHSSKEAVCYICGKKFQNLNSLQRHRLTHAPYKKHACTTCGKQFGRRDHLITHTKRKHSSSNDALKSNDGRALKTLDGNLAICTNRNDDSVKKLAESVNDGSQYLKMSPVKPPPPASTAIRTCTTSSSSSNRRKQTPTKLKALELNAETVTFVALPELLSPLLISEKALNRDSKKSTEKDFKRPDKVPEPISSNSISEHTTCNVVLNTKRKDEDHGDHAENSYKQDSLSASPLYPFCCYICERISFKRRGMLVNHMAKVHPSVDVEKIAVLNAPIVRQQLIYPCPYCSNVYKLNAKRKAHIIKHHPGQELPAPMRQNRAQAVEVAQSPDDVTNMAPPSAGEVVAAVGTMAVSVHKCDRCHKQYGARSRLLKHYRTAHPGHVVPPLRVQSPQPDKSSYNCRSDLFANEQRLEAALEPQQASLEPEINIIPYHLQPAPVSPENKLLKLSSAATLELSRFDDDFFSERDRGSNDDVEGSHVFADHATHTDLQHLSALFEEPSMTGIDANMEKYNRAIEAQFFEKITKFS